MSIAENHLIKVQVCAVLQGNAMSFSIHYACDNSVTNDTQHDLGNLFNVNVMPLIKAACSLEVRFQQLYTTAVAPNLAWTSIISYGTELGLGTAEAIPSNTAVIIELRQGEVTSRHNNRIFMFGCEETNVVNSLLTPTAISGSYQPLADYLLTHTMAGTFGNYKACSVTPRKKTGPVPAIGYDLVQAFVQPAVATQRRRTTELTQYKP